MADGSDGSDAGRCGELVEECVEEGSTLRGRSVAAIEVKLHGDSGGREAGGDVGDVAIAAEEEAGSGEKDEDECDLKDDEGAADAVASVHDASVAGGFEEFDQVDTGEGECREGSEDKAGEEGDGHDGAL